MSFDDYNRHIEEQSRFFRESGQYNMRGKGDTDMWKLFLERMMGLLTKGGMLSVVMPSGILTNEGAKDLRKAMLKMRIMSIYEFENRKRIFPEVHLSYKFVLLTASNIEPTLDFNAAFYLHDIASLHGKTEQEKFLTMPLELIHLTSPEVFAIPEIHNENDVEILNQIYKNHGCVRDGLDNGKYTISFVREFDRANDSPLFKDDGKGWPLIEGKNFHQFIPDYSQSEFTIYVKEGLDKTKKIKKYGDKNKQIHNTVRLVFRNVARSTDMRTMISCIIPPHQFFAHNSSLILLQSNNKLLLNNTYNEKILYLTAIFNSMTFDYLIRFRTNMNLSFFIVNSIAIPQDTISQKAKKIIKLSSTLTMQNEDFTDMAKSLQCKIKKLSIQERIKVTAELDALVAHYYGLSRDQYEYIMSTFKLKNQNDDLNNSVKWNASTIHTFNHEVKKLTLKFYDDMAIDI